MKIAAVAVAVADGKHIATIANLRRNQYMNILDSISPSCQLYHFHINLIPINFPSFKSKELKFI